MRYRLKCGGKPRRKAFAGADGAIMAAATLAASAANVAAQNKSASTQAKAIESNAKAQAQAIQQQTTNNNQLQNEYIQFSKEQNKLMRDQQQEMQTTLQELAGKENMNSRLDAGKIILRNGGIGNKRKLSDFFYRGANVPFKVTDGGGVLPIQTDNNGYGLYEIRGNDHEHYHKTSGGKHKSGVGIKFNDGSVVEGEGNQNTNQGELLYVTPQDAMFISKHSINGFNPTKAVQQGMHPQQAFNIQQNIKNMNGIADDGGKLPRRRSIASKGDWVDLINSLTTRKGIARGIREFSQGVPFISGSLDSFADYVEGNDRQPIYGIDANGNQHFIDYAPNNDNENALFSILSGPGSKMVKPIQSVNTSRLSAKNKKAIEYLANISDKLKDVQPTLFDNEATNVFKNAGSNFGLITKTKMPSDLRYLVKVRQGIRTGEIMTPENERIAQAAADVTKGATEAARTIAANSGLLLRPIKSKVEKAEKALSNIIQKAKNRRELRRNKAQWNEAAREWQEAGVTSDAYNRVNPTISNNTRISLRTIDKDGKNAIRGGLGLLGTGIGGYLLNSVYNSIYNQTQELNNSNNIPVNNNLAHPYIDSYKQSQQIQQDSIKNDTIKQTKQHSNITSKKQVTTQQAKQDAVNNNTSKTYKNFNEAFDAAIARGDKTFTFGGLEYAAKKAKGNDSRNRRWGARRTEQVMSKYKSWKDYLERNDKRKMKYGGRIKAKDGTFWNDYGGAVYNAAGSVGGGLISTLGGIIAGNKIGKAYDKAYNALYKTYSQMHGIDPSIINRDDFNTGHAIAAIQSADTNVSPILERARRNASYEANIVNRSTLSSAARQQRLAGINDRMSQRFSETYANKHNQDQQVVQGNMQRIQEASNTNAQLDAQAMQNYNQLRSQIAMYNNDIENNKIAGIGQAQADAITNSATIKGNALQQGLSALGSGLASAAGGFANAWQTNREYKNNYKNMILGSSDSAKVQAAIYNNDEQLGRILWEQFKNQSNPLLKIYTNQLATKFGFKDDTKNNYNGNAYLNTPIVIAAHSNIPNVVNTAPVPAAWLTGNTRNIYGL